MLSTVAGKKMVAIYVRKSRLKDAEALEIDRQVELLIDYAENNDMQYEVFSEEGSSEDWNGRPQLQKMLMALRNGVYDGVLVTDQDRLTRDRTDFGLFVRFAKSEGLMLFTLNKTYNFLNDDDIFTSGIQSEMDNHFMRMTKRKLKRGRIQAIKKGVFFGVAPFGYTKDESKHLYPHPEEAPVVELIFDLYVNGNMNQVEICEELDKRGKVARSGKPFNPRGTFLVLSNIVYRGVVHYELEGEDVINVEEAHPALVDADTFNKAQVIRAKRRIVPQSSQRGVYALSKLLVCPKCGQTLSFCMKYTSKESARNLDKSQRELFILNCYSSKGQKARIEMTKAGTPRCENNGVKASRVEQAVFDELKLKLKDIDAEIEKVLSGSHDFIAKVTVKQEELTLQYNQLESQKKNVQDGFKIGIYDAEEAQAEIKAIKERQLSIQQELKGLEGSDEKGEVERQQKLKRKIEHLLVMDKADAGKVNKLLHEVIDKVYFWKEEIDSRHNEKPFALVIELKD